MRIDDHRRAMLIQLGDVWPGDVIVNRLGYCFKVCDWGKRGDWVAWVSESREPVRLLAVGRQWPGGRREMTT